MCPKWFQHAQFQHKSPNPKVRMSVEARGNLASSALFRSFPSPDSLLITRKAQSQGHLLWDPSLILWLGALFCICLRPVHGSDVGLTHAIVIISLCFFLSH